jgi:hypothetical protein
MSKRAFALSKKITVIALDGFCGSVSVEELEMSQTEITPTTMFRHKHRRRSSRRDLLKGDTIILEGWGIDLEKFGVLNMRKMNLNLEFSEPEKLEEAICGTAFEK